MIAHRQDRQLSLLHSLADAYARREDAMVNPLRRFLLNKQIVTEARKIAHDATKTCKPRPTDEVPDVVISGDDNEHTKNCNALTRKVAELAMQVKLASFQPATARQQLKDDEDDQRDKTDANVD
jgi:hypothetical protein